MRQGALITLLSLVLGAQAAWDTSICSPVPQGNPTSGPPLPTVPDRYETHVECNFVQQKRTIVSAEYYDGPGNRGTIMMSEPGQVELNAIYNYQTGQILFYTPFQNGYACQVADPATSPQKFLFPYTTVNGTKYLASAAMVLNFDNTKTPFIYVGKETIRGIPVHHWKTCAYWRGIEATMNLDWYWSDNTMWNSPGTNQSIPIRAVAVGKISTPGAPSRTFDHRYDFIHFLPNAVRPETTFETPPGTICKNQLSTKAIPNIAQHFKFNMEITQPETKLTLYTKEWYDYKARLVRLDRKPVSIGGGNQNTITEIHDFNTGVMYTTDQVLGNCSYKPIPKVNEITSEVLADGANVRIRNPLEFLQLDKYPYTYTGTRTIRGVTCDVWITQRNDWPQGATNNFTSTWEWYFSTSDWVTASGQVFERGEPMMLELTAPKFGIHFIYNVFDFNEQQPDLWNYDISQCYTYLDRRHFQFALPGNFKGIVDVNKKLFRYFVLLSVTATAHVSVLRVNNIQVDFDENDILVTFTLLDRAPISGDVPMVVQEVPLDTASKLITDNINAGTFKVNMFVDTNQDPVTLTAKPYSVKEVIREVVTGASTGYSVGIMVAVALAMLLVGFAIGAGILFGVYKMRGGTFAPGASLFKNEGEA
ncbi:uncharacterized protein LOC135498987 [Lineus longissimus]|uniref:uncharacterized protein LOC135498987 n=1 Tax=Lineus longissimus TaxID=88925 RepID=UPI002B4C3AE7